MAENSFNGARCEFYCWSQGHSDLELRLKLNKDTKHRDIKVSVTAHDIRIEEKFVEPENTQYRLILEGKFEREVRQESLYWLIDSESSCLFVYLDKLHSCWWRGLLVDEKPIEVGQRFYSVPIETLDSDSRARIDKLINQKRCK